MGTEQQKTKKIAIGERIKEVFDKKDISIAQFAERLSCDRANIYNIFRRKKIDHERLIEISKILQHNFVAESYTKNGYSHKTVSQITLVLEIAMDAKMVKNFTKTLKQMEINAVYEAKN